MAEHSPAPWEIGKYPWAIDDANGDEVAQVDAEAPNHVANALRIVACVNHCEGFSTETLEVGPDMAELVDGYSEAESLRRQRDALLAACIAVDDSRNWDEEGRLKVAVLKQVSAAMALTQPPTKES